MALPEKKNKNSPFPPFSWNVNVREQKKKSRTAAPFYDSTTRNSQWTNFPNDEKYIGYLSNVDNIYITDLNSPF